MGRISRGRAVASRIKYLAALAAMALLLSDPEAAALGALQAAARWYASVAPALFPFLALMPLLTGDAASRTYERLLGRPMKALFDLPGAMAPALVAALATGAPAGSIAARNAAVRSGANRGQLHRVALALPGFSPAFLVGGVGVGMLKSARLGWRLLLSQVLTQLVLLLLLRRAWRDRTEPVTPGENGGGGQSVRGAVLTTLTICGYMMLFGAFAYALRARVGGAADVALCLLDVPSGAALISSLPLARELRLPLLSGLCGFGGVCIAAQNLSVLKGCGVRAWEYIALRLLAAALCALFTALPLEGMNAVGLRLAQMPFEAAALCACALATPILVKGVLWIRD